MALNQCVFQGNLTRDPERKQIPSGLVIANFTIAVSPSTKRANKGTLFLPCTAFGSVGENICKFFHKGSSVILSGRLECDVIDDSAHPGEKKQLFWLNISNFEFPSGGKGMKEETETPQDPLPGAIAEDTNDEIIADDDMPF